MTELRCASESIEALVLPELGARLHRLRAFGHDLLRTPPDLEAHRREPFFWGCYVMAPWCNRIAAEPLMVGGQRVAVPSNFADGTAIHGQVHSRPWRVHDDGLLVTDGGGDGWPWPYEVQMRVEAAGNTLRIDLALVHRAEEPMPGGIGIHPWFRRPGAARIRGDLVHPDNLATRPLPVPVTGNYDLRDLGPMPPEIDATWGALGSPPVELRWPDLRLRMVMTASAPALFVVAASPRQLDAVAIEPQTHAPHGLRRTMNGEPGGLVMLAPGETLELHVQLAFEALTEEDAATR